MKSIQFPKDKIRPLRVAAGGAHSPQALGQLVVNQVSKEGVTVTPNGAKAWLEAVAAWIIKGNTIVKETLERAVINAGPAVPPARVLLAQASSSSKRRPHRQGAMDRLSQGQQAKSHAQRVFLNASQARNDNGGTVDASPWPHLPKDLLSWLRPSAGAGEVRAVATAVAWRPQDVPLEERDAVGLRLMAHAHGATAHAVLRAVASLNGHSTALQRLLEATVEQLGQAGDTVGLKLALDAMVHQVYPPHSPERSQQMLTLLRHVEHLEPREIRGVAPAGDLRFFEALRARLAQGSQRGKAAQLCMQLRGQSLEAEALRHALLVDLTRSLDGGTAAAAQATLLNGLPLAHWELQALLPKLEQALAVEWEFLNGPVQAGQGATAKLLRAKDDGAACFNTLSAKGAVLDSPALLELKALLQKYQALPHVKVHLRWLKELVEV